MAAEAFLAGLAASLYSPKLGDNPDDNQGMWICDSSTAQAVFAAEDQFAKDYGLVSLFAKSRLNTEGASWDARWKMSQRQFNAASKPSSEGFVRECFEAAVGELEAGAPDLRTEILSASLQVFLTTMGISPSVPLIAQWMNGCRSLLTRLQYRSWVAPEAAEREQLQAECQAARRQFHSILQKDEASETLLRRFAEVGRDIEDFDAVGELAILAFGGSETTTASILWCLDILGRAPEVQGRIRDEILSGDTDAKYLRCFIHETLRRFPVVPIVARKCLESIDLNGRRFEKGQTLIVSIVGLHHQADKWQNPEIFDSSRAEFMNKSYDRASFMPFSAGSRACGGARLAMMEIEQALRAFLPRFTIHQPAEAVGFNYSLSLASATSGTIKLTPR